MADKKILVLTGVLAVGAATALLIERGGRSSADERLGKTLVDESQMATVDKVQLKKGGSSLMLTRDTSGVWHIGDTHGFAADATKIVQAFDALGRAKLTTVVSTKAEAHAGLGLAEPSEVELSSQGKPLASIKLGNPREAGGGSGGQYVTIGTDATAFLIDQAVSVAPDADAWELKRLLDVKGDLVRSVTFTPATALARKQVSLAREKLEDDFDVIGAAKTTPKASANLLERLEFTKRVDIANEEARTALEGASSALVTLFDGRVYEVRVGRLGEQNPKRFMSIKASGDATQADAAIKTELATLGKIMAAHSFEIPEHVASRFEKGLVDFVPEEPKKEAGKG